MVRVGGEVGVHSVGGSLFGKSLCQRMERMMYGREKGKGCSDGGDNGNRGEFFVKWLVCGGGRVGSRSTTTMTKRCTGKGGHKVWRNGLSMAGTRAVAAPEEA